MYILPLLVVYEYVYANDILFYNIQRFNPYGNKKCNNTNRYNGDYNDVVCNNSSPQDINVHCTVPIQFIYVLLVKAGTGGSERSRPKFRINVFWRERNIFRLVK